MRVGERAAGEQAERARRRARRAAPRRRSAGGPGAASRRGRAARRSPAGAGRSRARTCRRRRTARRRRRCRPSRRRSRPAPARSLAVGSPASASAAWPRSSTSTPGPRRSQPRAQLVATSGLGDDADRVDPAGRAGQRVRASRPRRTPRPGRVLAGAAVGEAADAVGRPRRPGGDDPQRVADARAEARVGDDVARPAGAWPAVEPVRRQRRAGPAVAAQPLGAGRARAPRASRRRRGTATSPTARGDAGHGGDALDGRGRQARAGDDVDAARRPRRWPMVTVGSARTTASAAARRPGPGALSAPAISRPVA